jgi:hypothetical protein
MSCDEFDSLKDFYEKSVRDFTESVKRLRAHTQSVPQNEYILLLKLSERARVKSEGAQRALRNHVIEHGCC